MRNKSKPTYISASLGLYLKNAPKEYRGLTKQIWTIGRDDPITLHDLCVSMVVHAVEFYGATTDIDIGVMCDEVDAVAKTLTNRAKKVRELHFHYEIGKQGR
jgi:hypothetical protein